MHRITQVIRSLIEKQGIKELRPAQSKALDSGLLKNKNLIVCTPTSSGKTLVAELAFLNHFLNKKGKTVYTCPLKALAAEKYRNFKRKYPEMNISLSIGDPERKEPYLAQSDLIICSNERFDSLLRQESQWVNEVSLLVVDEIHLLNDVSRGPTLEILITLSKRINQNLQVLGLSATIGNPEELASWLNAGIILDYWRPVELYKGIYSEGEIDFFNKKENIKLEEISEDPVINLALTTIKEGKQALLFVNTRRSAEAVAEKLSHRSKSEEDAIQLSEKIEKALINPTEQCKKIAEIVKKGIAFHHAGLVQKQKELIEEGFKDKKIKVICCTPTLALGIDLPAFRSIVRDVKRFGSLGMYYLPVLEIQQMFGRAGRPDYDEYGEAILIAKNQDEKEELHSHYLKGKPENIYSKLAVEPVLRTYLLSLISINFLTTKEKILKFFDETFWAFQFEDREKLHHIAESMLYLLKDYGFIEINEEIRATKLGKRVSQLYIDPYTANFLIQNLYKAQTHDYNDFSLIHLICNTLEIRPLLPVRSREYGDIEAGSLQHQDYLLYNDQFSEDYLNSIKTALMFNSWLNEATEELIMKKYNIPPGELKYKVDKAAWLLYSLQEIARILNYTETARNAKSLNVRMKHGIKEELLVLIQLKGIGRVKARRLFNSNIRTLAHLKIINLEVLKKLIGNKTAVSIKEQLGISIGSLKDY
ncbi:DEAD/DEAH box helicase [Candidatus Woesearchaeota archaeon]|nr:DEAD/DEAH box helicase [Candidatus Woesearchaeota archaeon]